jgi:small subunit ribosomal protein S7
MSRKHRAKKRLISGDPSYNSPLLHMLVNRVMKKGKKALAYQIVYAMMDQLAQKTEKDAVRVFEQAVRNVKPAMAVKPRRVGGSTYQIPYKVKVERGTVLALQWILTATRKRYGKTTVSKLTNEVLDAWNKTGAAMKRRNDVHRMAQANKAFARFRF